MGQQLLLSAPEHWQIKALSRGLARSQIQNISWKQADLFSLQSSTEALKDTDVAIYLVHSMLPSTRLFQGNFADADLLIADNFARACVKNGVQQIIYLGGLMPTKNISEHLESRQEVEEVFKTSGIPYTIFRAGMIAGKNGSSFEILHNLVKNLPGMVLPNWTKVKTQVVYIDDLVRVISASVLNRDFFNRTIDAVNGESLNYEKLIRTTYEALKKKPILFRVPIRSTKFSKLWVSVFGNTNYELASPLIDSLLCELPQDPPEKLISHLIHNHSFKEMLEKILKIPDSQNQKQKEKTKLLYSNTVRSIQRLPSVPSISCNEIALEFENWLSKTILSLIRVRTNPESGFITFNLRFLSRPLLVLQPILGGSEMPRAKFHIIGGLLSKRSDCGWLEFRQIANRQFTLVSINEFVPTLPWYIYRFTQAMLHKWTMNLFATHLARSNRFSN